MTGEELAALIEAEIGESEQLQRILDRIQDGSATFTDSELYAAITAEITAKQMRRNVLSLDGREAAFVDITRQRHSDTFTVFSAVQRILDARSGIRIKPQKPPFEDGRAHKIGHALEDKTVPESVIERRAESATENFCRSHHDDCMKVNAEFRDRAGMTSYIIRDGSAKCCDWCADVSGKFTLDSAPAGIWGRHDNCKCSIQYDAKKGGRQLLRGTSKKWEVVAPDAGAGTLHRLSGTEGATVGASDSVVLTAEQAETISRKKSLRVFGNGVDFPGEISIIKHGGHSYFPESISGVKQGASMTFEQANQRNVNPLYRKGGGYKSNCQSCVAVFEARLRGYNIEAKPMERHTVAYVLSGQTNLVWVDPVTGNHPSYIFNREANTSSLFLSFLENTIHQNQRFTLEFKLKTGSTHIIFADRDQSGALRLYDPQNGKVRTGHRIEKYLRKIDYSVPQHSDTTTFTMPDENYIPKLLRVDCCDFDLHIINGISTAKG